MARRKYLICLVALWVLACGDREPQRPAMPAAASSATEQAAIPVNDSMVTLGGGIATVEIPKGWQRVAKSKYEIEIEAARHKTDLDLWARCFAQAMSAPNLRGLSQEQWNDEMVAEWSASRFTPESGGALLKFSNSELLGDSRIVVAEFDDQQAFFSIRLTTVARGVFATAIHMSCDAAKPMGEDDRKDIKSFMRSLNISQK
jgi:hypothetical protein